MGDDRAIKSRAYANKSASVARSPHTAKDISAIESSQRRAARFVFNDYSRNSSVSVMLTDLGPVSRKPQKLFGPGKP